MELARLEQQIPNGRSLSERSPYAQRERDQRRGIEQA
jgi:hypothetical protein